VGPLDRRWRVCVRLAGDERIEVHMGPRQQRAYIDVGVLICERVYFPQRVIGARTLGVADGHPPVAVSQVRPDDFAHVRDLTAFARENHMLIRASNLPWDRIQ